MNRDGFTKYTRRDTRHNEKPVASISFNGSIRFNNALRKVIEELARGDYITLFYNKELKMLALKCCKEREANTLKYNHNSGSINAAGFFKHFNIETKTTMSFDVDVDPPEYDYDLIIKEVG